ncbi:TetR/AcrR family transcriptional regulator [Gordonia sp. NB41Y]|uniref:TetR/AcrR family transcriptional regulator n=1 Tax=Gordonia sp. NB41Y TaxID=875808 RepID=UPI0016510E6E|nr:TetR/AcrR family transcriptional regulator [Gordonia sp. NB41Y]WLP88544.1 TetR/AcrR family transcriptional regulator [Gordonia sp. NB41Y]
MTAEPTTDVAGGRRYGGADADERRTRRRAQLVEAGLDLFGEHGYPNVSVKRVCDHAGLTQRYFYESFADRTALLVAVYEECVTTARAEVLTAAAGYLDDGRPIAADDVTPAARAILGTFLDTLSGDPRRARVILFEVVGVDPTVESVRMRAIHDWAQLLLSLIMGERAPSPVQRLAAVGLIGAITQLLVDWYLLSVATEHVDIGTTEPADLGTILDVLVEMLTATYDRLMR